METWYQRSWIFLILGALTHLCLNSGSELSHSFCSSSPSDFPCCFIFPSYTLLQSKIVLTASSENSLWLPREEENVLRAPYCHAAHGGDELWGSSSGQDMGTAGASALPGLVIDPAKVEITHKCFVISLVLSLARQKVEQSWKSQCQELFFRALCFHLVWYWHSMEQHERDREKHLSEEERGPRIMKSSTEIRVGGVEIFLHARFLATFKLILSVHFNTVTEVA